MDLTGIDWAGLGTAISIVAKSNPVVALATGVITGILGEKLFEKKRKKKKELREKNELLEAIKLRREPDESA